MNNPSIPDLPRVKDYLKRSEALLMDPEASVRMQAWQAASIAGVDYSGTAPLLCGDNSGELQDLILKAKSDLIAWEACLFIAADLTENKRSLPHPLQYFIISIATGLLTKPKKRGPSVSGHVLRDNIIRNEVAMAIWDGGDISISENGSYILSKGLAAYSNGNTSSPSACEIVANYLHEMGVPRMSQDAIQKIWKKSPIPLLRG